MMLSAGQDGIAAGERATSAGQGTRRSHPFQSLDGNGSASGTSPQQKAQSSGGGLSSRQAGASARESKASAVRPDKQDTPSERRPRRTMMRPAALASMDFGVQVYAPKGPPPARALVSPTALPASAAQMSQLHRMAFPSACVPGP
jgi:hypothetical protein